MKNKIVLLGLFLLQISTAKAYYMCQVDMVDPRGRVLNSFSAQTDQNGMCREGLKDCSYEMRMRNIHGARCIARTSGQSAPYPTGPMRPHPTPPPISQPGYGQGYASVEVNSLALDVARSVTNSEEKTKIANDILTITNDYQLASLVRVCSSTRSWFDNANCLTDGLQRAPRVFADEFVALQAVKSACQKTTSWYSERSCFQAAFSNGRFISLGYLSQSCASIANSESSARCYRSI
jgi:hypothetical protein